MKLPEGITIKLPIKLPEGINLLKGRPIPRSGVSQVRILSIKKELFQRAMARGPFWIERGETVVNLGKQW